MEPTSFHQLPLGASVFPPGPSKVQDSEPGHQLPGACGSNFPSAVLSDSHKEQTSPYDRVSEAMTLPPLGNI